MPTILIITPDTYNVVDLNKLLVYKYSQNENLENNLQYDVHVSKLFAKHIKPEEQAESLAKKHPNAKVKRVINIYIGTPNRLLKLSQMDAFDIGKKSDRLRYLIVDCRLNKKNFSIFETHETKNDAIELLKEAKLAFEREGENKLKVALI